MVWTIPLQRVAAILATVLMSTSLLCGCVSDSPHTQLSWYPKGDRIATVTPTPKPTKRHVTPIRNASLDCPVPRAKPGWYTQNVAPPPAVQPATYTPAPGGAVSFVWPVQGRVISDFGADLNGGRNDGVNIAAALGTPIRAAAAGQISYAGDELKGYGNLILIKHDDGYVTAYAHAERIIVNRGDYVAKGQVIGYAGQTGDVATPQLHFEIRKGVQPVNPHTLLASRAS